MKTFLEGQRLYLGIGLVLLIVAVLGLTYCSGTKAGKNAEVVKSQARTIDTERKVGAANENAAAARVNDATKAAQREGELRDALAATDDPDKQRVLRGCIIMRQQGRDTTDIPACR